MTFWQDPSPEFARAFERAMDIMDRSIDVTCAWKTCTHHYDPVEKRLNFGWGDAMCGCEWLPGWRARHPEGLPKPSVPVKAKGRHGSRVQRSRARRREWRRMVAYVEGPYVIYDEVADFLTPEAINQ